MREFEPWTFGDDSVIHLPGDSLLQQPETSIPFVQPSTLDMSQVKAAIAPLLMPRAPAPAPTMYPKVGTLPAMQTTAQMNYWPWILGAALLYSILSESRK